METEFQTQVRALSVVALDAIETMAHQSDHMFLRSFPAGSCDATSFAIGMVLVGREVGAGAGDWYMVTGAQEKGHQMHTWVEYRHGDVALYTIDGTLHQFAELADAPYIGSAWPGVSPSVAAFPVQQRAVLLRGWSGHVPPEWQMALDAANGAFL
ncbi:hypothetical protein [Leifsonia aquatica]|uniref:hypothetical protein n=1 Tax=Leifsonia aquatica TaxID=144185 RepID=UPI0038194760